MVVGVTGLLAPSQVLRHRLLKFFHANYTHPDLFDRLQDEISAELRTLFKSFSSVLSEVHLSDFIAIVLVGVDQQQKIRCICWNSESDPDFHAVEYFDDFVCLGNDLAVTHAQLLLSLRNPYLGPAESLLELELVAHEVAKKYPECVSPSGLSFLINPGLRSQKIAVDA